ncbi:hypothetical protein LTR08_005316 [Meristemomyces frigidus]|nr:hypothetical protein LTR08_005316 [Meristemomyces frigidus]
MPRGEYGTTSAATVARDMIRSFPTLRIGLMVGIGGGAPSGKHDIRLGDIVVSSPSGGKGGVYQYDYGKTVQDRKFEQTGHLNEPPAILLAGIADLEARIEEDGHDFEENIEAILSKKPRLQKRYGRPDGESDQLYRRTCVHPSGNEESCAETCANQARAACHRQKKGEHADNPAIHYGLIASANQLMKDATVRDALAEEMGVLCFEMEAAGLMNQFPFLVIRGICDYADSHKNKQWQGYAAMTAAAYAKRLLQNIAPSRVEVERKIGDMLQNIGQSVDRVHTIAQETNETVRVPVDDHRRQLIDRWLSPPDVSVNYNRAKELRHADTGLWLLESDQYKDWKAKVKPALWLHGIPGCGKSVLSSTIITDIQQSGMDCVVLYFYFDFNDASKQIFDKMLRSLISQLYLQCEESQKHLDHLYTSCRRGTVQASSHSLVATLQVMMEEAGDLTIVLDALDECTTRKELLSWLASLSQEATQILMTSRKEEDIESSLTKWILPSAVVPVQQAAVDKDILAVVRSRISEDQELQRWQSMLEVRNMIETRLMEKADGM